MKPFKQFLVVLIIGLTLTFESGCIKKGPDDPFISFQTRQKRMCQDWILLKYEKNSSSIDLSGSYSEWDIHDNGTILQTYGGTIFGFTARTTSVGTWSFLNNGQNMTITNDNDTKNYFIDRLASTELWLTRYDGSDTYFLHFHVK